MLWQCGRGKKPCSGRRPANPWVIMDTSESKADGTSTQFAEPATGASPPEAPANASFTQGVRELLDACGYFLYLQVDRAKGKARKAVWLGIAAVMLVVVLLTILATAAVLVCIGLSAAITTLTGSAWAGTLITGVGLLLLAAGALVGGAMLVERRTNAKLKDYYGNWRKQQTERFGRDIHS